MDYSEDVLDWQEFDILPPRLQMSGTDVRAESERDQLKLVTLLCGQESLSYIFSKTCMWTLYVLCYFAVFTWNMNVNVLLLNYT